MSDFAIKVESLGKKFIIGHEKAEKYTALRDVISNNVKGVWKKTRELVSGNYWVEGNEEEEFWALKDLNFTINQGDRVGIIGRNGAGKSTLLKILSRITEPTEGRITIQGRVASLLEVGTGFHPELSGRENIYLNGAILGMSRADIKRKFDEIVDFAEVERFLDTPVKRYSSGMYVRLAFSVAAHLEPDILIVDEVLAVGDAQFQKKCLGKMEDVSKNQGRTVLFVSHNMGVIAQLCKKSILLKNGRLIEFGETQNVINEYILNLKKGSNKYLTSLENTSKSMYVNSVETQNANSHLEENFQFSENIFLVIEIVIKEYDPTSLVSITLQNSSGDYLSTFVESISELFEKNKKSSNQLKIKLPSRLIAPNTYAFRVALFSPQGSVYDLVEMVCPVKIYDNGSKMSLFEGINYGSFFMDYEIQEIEHNSPKRG